MNLVHAKLQDYPVTISFGSADRSGLFVSGLHNAVLFLYCH